ncbi:hypothetical protein [Segetibacter koreensis]|uniref:hypothetical protein n=1 Tax=Segetibacter koreensis TaxID=398037 RepID=UPI000374EAD9|nr:hypothetical protein [Segetibacter koreensis]
MIPLKELRLGNIVKVKEQPLTGMDVYAKIAFLGRDIPDLGKGGVWVETEGTQEPVYAESIDPIELTPQILINCKFFGDFTISIEQDDKLSGLQISPTILVLYEGQRIPVKRLQYLHQLQNLYYDLTGEEIIIESLI